MRRQVFFDGVELARRPSIEASHGGVFYHPDRCSRFNDQKRLFESAVCVEVCSVGYLEVADECIKLDIIRICDSESVNKCQCSGASNLPAYCKLL